MPCLVVARLSCRALTTARGRSLRLLQPSPLAVGGSHSRWAAYPQLTACISSAIFYSPSLEGGSQYIRSTELWEAHRTRCADSVANAVMLALPFWWRLMQCLKVTRSLP